MGLLDFILGREKTLHDAIRSGDLSRAAALIPEDGFDAPDSRGCTPLYWACQQGYEDIAQQLIEQGADVNARDKEGSSPLRTAVFQNRIAIVKILLYSGADPNIKHGDGSTPLHAAAEVGDVRVVEMLLAHDADINARHDYGEPIYAAAEKNQTPVVSYLLKKGATIRVKHKQQETLLHALAFQGHDGLIEDLISRGLDVNARNNEGKIPLHYAVEEFSSHRDMSVIERLIAAGSDSNVVDNSAVSPLVIAKQNGYHDVVRIMT